MAMTKSELKRILDENRVVPNCYVLDDSGGTDQYVLSEEDGVWSVFYAERGHKNGLRHFSSESEACEYMLRWILEDDTPGIRETDERHPSPY